MPSETKAVPRLIITTDASRVRKRRHALMLARQAALARRDFGAMNEITRRLAKLPVPVVRNGVVTLDYGA